MRYGLLGRGSGKRGGIRIICTSPSVIQLPFGQQYRNRISLVRPNDTTAAAHAVHIRAYRNAGPEQRVAIAAELSEAIRELSRAGVRMRHPELSDDEVTREVCRIFYGERGRERHGR